jgi:hypothetical protein
VESLAQKMDQTGVRASAKLESKGLVLKANPPLISSSAGSSGAFTFQRRACALQPPLADPVLGFEFRGTPDG